MAHYIDTDKLRVILHAQIKEREEWMKNSDKSDRQDQLWSDLNNEDRVILSFIESLEQEPVDLEIDKEITL